MGSGTVISLEGHGLGGGHSVFGPLERSRVIAERFAKARLQALFENVDDTLFEMADKADNNAVQDLYFDTMRSVRIAKGEVAEEFQREVSDGFRRLPSPPSANAAAADNYSFERMELLDDASLEESLAIDDMVEKVNSTLQVELEALTRRFGHLLGRDLGDTFNPVGPRQLCAAFATALKALDAEIRVRLIIYKMFDRYVIGDLGSLYAEVNRQLINEGVLPELVIERRPFESRGGTPRRPAAPLDPAAAAEAASGDLGIVLQHLLALGGGTASAAGADAAGGQLGPAVGGGVAAPPQLLGALQVLQQRVVDGAFAGGGAVSGGLRGALTQELDARGAEPLLNRLDDAMIDVIGMLFDFILDDDDLPDAVKALLGRLQIPMLKVALLDKEFLARRQHPARQLLNELARAGVGVDDGQEGSELLALIERVVDRVLTEFEDDVALFSGLLAAFRGSLAELEQRCAEAGARAEEEVAAREREVRARQRVDQLFANLTPRLVRLPQVVEQIANDVWRTVMTKVALDDDPEGGEWEAQVRVLQTLCWSVEPKPSTEDRRNLALAIPDLLRNIRAACALIGMRRSRCDALVASIEPFHLAGLRGDNLEPPPLSVGSQMPDDLDAIAAHLNQAGFGVTLESTADAEGEDIVLGGDDEARGQEDDYTQLVRELKLGQWVEFDDEEQNRRRGRLIYRSQLLGELTFVDWRHKVVAQKTVHGLATDFRRGAARLITAAPVLDRALGAVISRLRGGDSGPPVGD